MTKPKYPYDPKLNHQYKTWVRFTCQCRYRKEACDLTWEQYRKVWGNDFHRRGRKPTDLVLTRKDPEGAWTESNVHLITRLKSLQDKNYAAAAYRRAHGLGYNKRYA